MGVQKASLAQTAHGRPSPASIVSQRLAAVRDDYVSLVADALIVRQRADEWGLHRRQVWRYLKLVKARYKRERTEADADFLRQLEGVVVANMQRARATEEAAAKAKRAIVVGGAVEYVDARDHKGEIAASAQELRGVERLCAMRGLDAARPQEDASENPFRQRERIMRELGMRTQPLLEATVLESTPTNGHANGNGTNGHNGANGHGH